MMTKAIPEWAGMFSSKRSRASSPPADAPMPMIGKFNELGTNPDSSRSGETGDENLVMGARHRKPPSSPESRVGAGAQGGEEDTAALIGSGHLSLQGVSLQGVAYQRGR